MLFAILKAINKNESETLKWEKYLEEMRQAESSLRDFQKKLQVECMVPIGTKALMPGFLYHTSEILVGNGSKIFSKCTTFEALKICKHRQKYAEDRLTDLRTEHDLHKNKLELPFMQNAFGNQGQEIIEAYDEAKEREWREKHKKSVAAQKRQEREERGKEQVEKTHDEVINLLEELELMDELESELESMDVRTDDQLRQLMSGEIQPPQEKKRVSHVNNKRKDVIVDGALPPATHLSTESEVKSQLKRLEKEVLAESRVEPAPIPIELPPVIIPEADSPPDEGNYSAESETESDIDSTTVSQQVYSKWRDLFEESKMLTRKEKRRYLKQKIKDVQISLAELVVHDVDTLTTRIDLNDLKDLIVDELIRLGTPHHEEQLEPQDSPVMNETPKKRRSRISFAQADDIKLIDKFEAPCKVSDSGCDSLSSHETTFENDLTNEIKFRHSEWPAMEPCKTEEDEISCPIDIYNERFGYFPKEKPIVDLVVTSLPSSKESSCEDLKSILKNKEKVLQETHVPLPVEKPTKKEKKVRKVAQVTDVSDKFDFENNLIKLTHFL